MKTTGIYRIKSRTKPERFYIGSSVNVESRWKDQRERRLNNPVSVETRKKQSIAKIGNVNAVKDIFKTL